MRMAQFIGLSLRAKSYVEDNCKRSKMELFKDGVLERCYVIPVKKPGKKIFGMFEEEIQLYDYELQDGSFLKEVEQASPWSSGPVIFTYLEDKNGKKIGEWTRAEMNKFL